MDQSFQNTAVNFAHKIAKQYSESPEVTAVTLGGSAATGRAEPGSDIDLYIYSEGTLRLEARRTIAESNAVRSEVNNQFWESGDEWIDAQTNIHVDVMFRETKWIEGQLYWLLEKHQASVGYSTCFWHNVLTSTILFDRAGWYMNLKQKAERPYPPELQQNIINKNFPILRDTLSSYLYQINSAIQRNDTVSLNHRIAALLASYFDILFALNKLPHPGEKRLLHIGKTQCKIKPKNMEEQVNALLTTSVQDKNLTQKIHSLIDGLEILLQNFGV